MGGKAFVGKGIVGAKALRYKTYLPIGRALGISACLAWTDPGSVWKEEKSER